MAAISQLEKSIRKWTKVQADKYKLEATVEVFKAGHSQYGASYVEVGLSRDDEENSFVSFSARFLANSYGKCGRNDICGSLSIREMKAEAQLRLDKELNRFA